MIATTRRLGLSRTQYLRRQLSSEAAIGATRVTPSDLIAFAATFADLDDPDLMAAAWG